MGLLGFVGGKSQSTGPARQVRPPQGGTNIGSLSAIFGEEPANVSETPRTVTGNYPIKGEPLANAPLAAYFGWIFRPSQTKGMSTLFVDQVAKLPEAGISAGRVSTIGQSDYVPYNHYRTAWWLFSGWDPIQRFTNTYMDVRWSVGKPPALSNGDLLNQPGHAAMGPYNAPFGSAWQIPRFSTEPKTTIPQSR